MNLWKLVSGNSSGNFYILKFIQSLAMRNSLLSKINHLSIYQVPKDTKLETRLDVSKVIRVKMEMMSLDKVGIHGKCNQYVPLDLLQIRANNNAPPCHRQVLQLYRDLCLSISSVLTVEGLL